MKKLICKLCGNLICTDDPKFIKPEDIRKGMKLKPWFYTKYKPSHGNYRPCDGYVTIRRVDDDFIYHSTENYTHVSISVPNHFDTYTIYEE